MRVPRRLALLALAGAGTAYLRKVHRYRDPVRFSDPRPGELLCPADGMVSFVRRIEQGQASHGHTEELDWPVSELFRDEVPQEGWLVGLLVSPLDVLYTSAPADGEVRAVRHVPGSRLPLGGRHLLQMAARQPVDLLGAPGTRANERLVLTFQTSAGDVHVAAIGSRRGLQGTTYLNQGDTVRAGHKALFLPEGGLVVVYFPLSVLPQVGVGDRVQGGQTVMARSA
ncbi:hypothetical protein D3875_05240 [Deinococcus cavernae]|uniref:Phosphatidylserine decarboxylase n=1 Tax=Deinococcus cavernae TaxID=2320857 RepID=A0A418V4Y9_9DEIO|nr:phosphatidylserine decarboxylase [Deinococcus cavernae]RJF71075.1 hypothetical protein D3875_05240 [Deinococcus cavernae]